ncbi:MAG TPA: 5'-methylthioadenosine/S-adenosylhomocysteine nucleosidase [Candidatus Limnocylindria bacterium]|nr:5'-methylthioadenosine/S-adenosylhomocysteine nucleosidase [Candidatus Limnocylindria bacterium]
MKSITAPFMRSTTSRFPAVYPFLFCLILGLAGCATSPRAASTTPPAKNLIAVMSAFDPEITATESLLIGTNPPVAVTRINGVTFKQVKFEGHDLLLFASGMSLVNAAMTTQLAIDHFHVSKVLFAGIAGGINPAHRVGDVVVPEKWYHHSEAVYANPKPDGSGYILPEYFKPTYENFGFMFPDNVTVIRDDMTTPARTAYFAADPALLETARQALKTLPPIPFAGRRADVSVGGNGVSGPVFMDNREYRKWTFRVWQAECLDMESTAIGQVCWANHTPFLIIRSLSDLAGGQEGINAADAMQAPASANASLVLREVLRAMK